MKGSFVNATNYKPQIIVYLLCKIDVAPEGVSSQHNHAHVSFSLVQAALVFHSENIYVSY